MLINAANLGLLFQSLNTVFKDAYLSMPQSLLDAVGQRVPSTTLDQRYPIVQTLSATMRQFLGERHVQNIALDAFVVTNVPWECTVGISRPELEDDQYGVYSSMIVPNVAHEAKLLPELEVAKIFNNNPTCYDGRSLFASNHYIDPSAQTGSQSNALTGKPLNATNLAIAQQTMMAFKAPNGVSLGGYGDTLLVPPSLDYVAKTLANAAFFPESKNNVSGVFGAQGNVFKGAFNVVTSPYLTDTGNPTTAVWYLLDSRSPSARAVLWQDRKTPEFVAITDPSNALVFMNDKYYMGAYARGAAAPSLWFKAIQVSGA